METLISVRNIVWGAPLIILLLGTGIYLTIALRGIQFTKLFPALYLALIKRKESAEGDITHFQALMTALAATVGTGNIAGVATAITAGGPGALFWMWITGLFGMATKYSEALLAVKYRVKDKLGTMSGGPMYYLTLGLKSKSLGILFAIFASLAAFGIGNMVQSNSVADAVHSFLKIPFWATGLVLTILTGLVIIGGIKSIAKVTGVLVPFIILTYFLAAVVALLLKIDKIPHAFELIFKGAFTGTAAMGGFLGAGVKKAVQMGVVRGLFSNESGLGSAPIAAAAAQTKNPVNQALVSMTQTFIDTLVVCTMTGLVIITSGVWTSGENGAPLSSLGFKTIFSQFLGQRAGNFLGGAIIALGLILFAYSTILGWSYYGEKSLEFLLGEKSVLPYRVLFTVFVFIGSVLSLKVVWTVADIMNGLMAFPNLVGLLGLSGIIVSETRKYT
ncbi:MAG: sodium:alanine symporter family protein [Candidatus Aminicenantes bacterium]|nr:sodium:alanine symporter family protein [Candidatus Aminicenantes bacterium]